LRQPATIPVCVGAAGVAPPPAEVDVDVEVDVVFVPVVVGDVVTGPEVEREEEVVPGAVAVGRGVPPVLIQTGRSSSPVSPAKRLSVQLVRSAASIHGFRDRRVWRFIFSLSRRSWQVMS